MLMTVFRTSSVRLKAKAPVEYYSQSASTLFTRDSRKQRDDAHHHGGNALLHTAGSVVALSFPASDSKLDHPSLS